MHYNRWRKHGTPYVEIVKYHGMARSPEYQAWRNMKCRCTVPTSPGYKNWGGRGIKVCERWSNSFANFYEDVGPKPPGAYLDRIDNEGDYEPNNVRWATPQQQFVNRRRPNGELRKGTSPYRGVRRSGNGWVASITVNYRLYRSKTFPTALEAAREWNRMALEYRGEDAILLEF